MRLRDIQEVLKAAAPGLRPRPSNVALQNGAAGAVVQNRSDVVDALALVAQLPTRMGSTARGLLEQPFVAYVAPEITGPQGDVHLWAQQVNALAVRVDDMLDAIAAAIPKQSELTISVCIPPPTTPGDLAATSLDLHFIFNEALGRLTGEQVHVQNLDSGSDWIELVAQSAIGLQVISEFLGLTRAYTLHRRDDERSLARLRAASLAEAQIQSSQAAFDATRRNLFEPRLEQLANASPGGKKSKAIREDISYAINAMERLSGLTDKGAKVVLALTAPTEAKHVAPTRKQVESLARGAVAPVAQLTAAEEEDSGDADDDVE